MRAKSEPSRNAFLSGISRNIILLGLVSLFTDLSSQAVFPLLPLFLTTQLGVGAVAVGIVEGAAETTASLLKVFSGYWSDRIRKRKPFVFAGYTLSALTKPLFAFAQTWPFVLGVRVVERMGKGLRTAPRDAIVAESADVSVRGKAFGFQRAMDGIGSVLGAVLAFIFLPLLGYRKLFLWAFLPGLLAVAAVLVIRDTGVGLEEKKKEKLHVALRALPTNLRVFIIAASVFALAHFGYAFLLLKAKDIGLTDARAILLYILFYVVYTLLNIPLGILSDKIGRKKILVAGYALFSLIALALVYVDGLVWLAIAFGVYGISYAMIDASQRSFVVDLCPKHLKATALGTFHTAIGLVALPGGFIAGMLWDSFSPGIMFLYAFAMASLSVAMLVLVKSKSA